MAAILIVSHQVTNKLVLEKMASAIDDVSAVRTVTSQSQAIKYSQGDPPDLVLLDAELPDSSPTEFALAFRRLPQCGNVPLLFLTSRQSPSHIPSFLLDGITDFLPNPPRAREFVARARTMLTLRSQQHLLANRTTWLERKVAEATQETRKREQETLLCLAKAGEFRDEDTGAHVLRMARYSEIIARKLGLPSDDCQLIERASPMHDIGKIGVSDSILLKPDRLTSTEFETLKQHTTIGYHILRGSASKYLQMGALIAHSHHERWDGSGYPAGLRGEDIPLPARIVSVADVFDALTSWRPYKTAWPLNASLDYLREEVGSIFDADCVGAFLDGFEEIQQVYKDFRDDRNGESPVAATVAVPKRSPPAKLGGTAPASALSN